MTTHPLPVVDLTAFALLFLAMLTLHALRVQTRPTPEGPPPEDHDANHDTLLDRAYHAGAWITLWLGAAIALRLIGFV